MSEQRPNLDEFRSASEALGFMMRDAAHQLLLLMPDTTSGISLQFGRQTDDSPRMAILILVDHAPKDKMDQQYERAARWVRHEPDLTIAEALWRGEETSNGER